MRAKGRGARRRERPVRELDNLLARSECGGRTFPPPIFEEKDLKRGKGRDRGESKVQGGEGLQRGRKCLPADDPA